MAYDVNATLEYYADLLLYQYNDKPRARETIKLLVAQAICDHVTLYMNDAFDLETAEGPQLDILGEYIGFNRVIPIPIPQPYFQLDDYVTPVSSPVGFRDYLDPLVNETSVFYLYIFVNESFSTLNDSQYLFMLKLKIVLNNLFNSLANISEALLNFFGPDVICLDQADMTISYLVQNQPSYLLSLALNLDLLPKPMGVRISGVFLVTDTTKVFKFADYTYDTGADVELANYLTGFNDKLILNYLNKVA